MTPLLSQSISLQISFYIHGVIAGVPGHPKRSAATPQAAALQNIIGSRLRDCRLTS